MRRGNVPQQLLLRVSWLLWPSHGKSFIWLELVTFGSPIMLRFFATGGPDVVDADNLMFNFIGFGPPCSETAVAALSSCP